MVLEKQVSVEGECYSLTISDEEEALSSASAVGRAVLGIWDPNAPQLSLPSASYLVERGCEVSEELAERVVRRKIGLPWIICRTPRLVLREFGAEDWKWVPENESESRDDRVFCSKDTLEAYIRHQYGFYEYGIWAVVKADSGEIIGKAGITNLQLEGGRAVQQAGYHIFSPHRSQGYGRESLEAVLRYGKEELELERLYVRIEADNAASIRLAGRSGFIPAADNAGEKNMLLYAVNLTQWRSREGKF